MTFAGLASLYVAVVCIAQVAANKIVVLPVWHLAAPGGTYPVLSTEYPVRSTQPHALYALALVEDFAA